MTAQRTITKLLVANRGEIAVRIFRTCRDLGIRTVAVFSDADRTALHVHLADEAYRLPGISLAETYLNQKAILEIAKNAHADAIHPGYGFLAENADFSGAVASKEIIFVGPTAEAIRRLGTKTEAKKLARALGIPVIPGPEQPVENDAKAREIAQVIGLPAVLKAAAGGGGKGMRIMRSLEEIESAFHMASSEARNAFGDDRLYIEKLIEKAHHVEVQVLADLFGNVVHLRERDCTIQRRHQKLIEESPSRLLDDTLRQRICDAAVLLIRKAAYTNAGTVEFLIDDLRQFYFLEVNTRLQVEHPVTEMMTGLDLVKEQINIAEGRPLPFKQADLAFRGHAIECRICAEDPAMEFFPSTGKISRFQIPSGPYVRVDTGARAGDDVQIHYDSLLAKLVVWGTNRTEAIARSRRALDEFYLEGVSTTIGFLKLVLTHKVFHEGLHDTEFISKEISQVILKKNLEKREFVAALASVLIMRERGPFVTTYRNGEVRESKWKAMRAENWDAM